MQGPVRRGGLEKEGYRHSLLPPSTGQAGEAAGYNRSDTAAANTILSLHVTPWSGFISASVSRARRKCPSAARGICTSLQPSQSSRCAGRSPAWPWNGHRIHPQPQAPASWLLKRGTSPQDCKRAMNITGAATSEGSATPGSPSPTPPQFMNRVRAVTEPHGSHPLPPRAGYPHWD